MGFYLRKSISVGPFRFNLSKSGVGVSAGVKGLRFGVGPRGNYIHMGRGGLYYRATIPQDVSSKPEFRPTVNPEPSIPPETHAPLEEIESADVSQIVDSSSRELLNELNQKQQKSSDFSLRFWRCNTSSPHWAHILAKMAAGAFCHSSYCCLLRCT